MSRPPLFAFLFTLAACTRGGGPPKLVGSRACANCHATEYAEWQRSHHSQSMQEARSNTILGRFDESTFTSGSVTSKFFRRENRYFVNTEGADGKSHDFEIRYTFGVYPLQQYLVAFPGGRIQPLPVAWDSRAATEGGQRWFQLNPGPQVTHTDDLHWTGRQQNWNFMCADCHSTGVRKGYDPSTDKFKTTWSEISVGCEACHGPASNHVAWARYPKVLRNVFWRDDRLPAQLNERKSVRWSIDSTTGNARRSVTRSTAREVESCASCHSRRVQIAEGYTAGSRYLDYYVPSLIVSPLYYPDGQQRDEVYTHVSFQESRMNHAGVTCSDCHSPHTLQPRAVGNQVCAQCHRTAKYDTPQHTLHPLGTAGAECTSCHMPATTYMQVDPRLEHSIRIPRPDRSVSFGAPNACNGCHSDKSAEWASQQIAAHFGEKRKGFQEFAEAFAADDRNAADASHALSLIANDSNEPTVVRASALARLASRPGNDAINSARLAVTDSSALIRRAALEILEGYDPRERVAIAAPLLTDSVRAVRIEAARILAPATRMFDAASKNNFLQAESDFMASQRLHADRPENRVALGIFLSQLGRSDDAVKEYNASIHLDPKYTPAYVNLADVFRVQGREADAESVLRSGIAASPSDATLHHALGLSLVRSKKLADAIPELEKAAELAPDQSRFAYVYAVALHSAGRDREALRVLGRARTLHPDDDQIRSLIAAINQTH